MNKQDFNIFDRTPVKNYYTYKHTYLYVIQKMKMGRIAILTSIKDNPKLYPYLDQLVIHRDDIKQTYMIDNELCVICKKNITQDKLLELIDDITNHLSSLHIKQICHKCGKETDVYYTHYDEDIEILCDDCINTSIDIKHRSHIEGIVSSCLLLLIPTIIWILGHQIGYIGTLTGILFSIIGLKGYELLGEYLDDKSYVIVSIMIFIQMIVGQLYVYIQETKKAFSTMGMTISNTQAFSAFTSILDAEVLMNTFIYFVLTLLFVAITMIIIHKKYKRKHLHFNIIDKL